MFKDTVTESVAADVMHNAPDRQRRRGPEKAALFIAKVKSFSAGIAHRIVVPGSKAEFVGILAPGAGKSALRNDRPEVRVGNHIHPWRRRHLPLRCSNDVLAAIGRESSEAVKEQQIAAGHCHGSCGLCAKAPGRHKVRHYERRDTATVDLLRERAKAVGDDCAADCLEQDAVLRRYLVYGSYEDASRSFCHVRFNAGGDDSHDLLL